MTDIQVPNLPAIVPKISGSQLLGELVLRHREISMRLWHPRLPTFPPLPASNIKPLELRVAEAEAFRGILPSRTMKDIVDAIYSSAAYFGEYPKPKPITAPPKIRIQGRPKVSEIQKMVAFYFNISIDDILSARRAASVVRPRQIAMYLSRILGPAKQRSFPEIGRLFCGRDHSTVIHGFRKISKQVNESWWFATEIAALKDRLLS